MQRREEKDKIRRGGGATCSDVVMHVPLSSQSVVVQPANCSEKQHCVPLWLLHRTTEYVIAKSHSPKCLLLAIYS
jgi:hypothetical protein